MQFILSKNEHGQLKGAAAIRQHLEKLKPGIYRVEIKGWRKIKDQQRALWWIWIDQIAQQTGHDRWTLHVALKAKFANLQIGPDGIPVVPSIEDNTPSEQAELLSRLQQWAMEYHQIELRTEYEHTN
jgi:hypothetical protein